MHGDAPDIDEFLDSLAAGLGIKNESILLGDVGSVVGTHTGRA